MVRDIHVQMARLQFDASVALLWLVSAPFYGLGWLVGFVVRCVLWAVAAIIAGYKAGKG